MKKTIEERIVESGLFDFSDGYLGSTNHCVDYYYCYDEEDINEIVDENDLKSLELDWEGFEEWFDDCDDWEIIDDNINGGRGYGKIVVDKVNKVIEIMVVPCLFDGEGNEIKIFGFDYESGELVREIDNEKLNEMLKKGYYVG
jgi:hypothetical protein